MSAPRTPGARSQGAAALGAYLALWLGTVGPRILPHLTDRVLAGLRVEASVFVWSLRWWPHALGRGANPLFSDAVWAPTGINLAWVPTSPGPSLLAAPLTVSLGPVGPVVAYNVLALLAPPLTAWTAFLLCRHLAGRFWPALAGGFVFGFSPHLMREVVQGHLNLSLLFLLPVAAHLVVRRVQGGMSRRRFVVLLTVVLVSEFAIFTEVVATMAVVGFLVWLGAVLLGPREARSALLDLGALVLLSYALAAVAVSPYLYAAVAHPEATKPPGFRGIATGVRTPSDLLRFLVPGPGLLVGSPGRRRLWNPWYFGGPLVVLLALSWGSGRQSGTARALALGFLVSVVLALGPSLPVGGVEVPLPWAVLERLPLIGRARPGRLVAFAFLFASVAVSLWAAGVRGGRRSWGRAALLGAALLALVPNVRSPVWTSAVPIPPFISTHAYRRYLSPGEVVLVVEGAGAQLFWQAHSDLYFRTAGWYQGFRPADYQGLEVAISLGRGSVPAGDPAVPRFLREHRVTSIIAGPGHRRAAEHLASVLGSPAVEVGGVVLVRVPPDLRGPAG